MVQIFKFLSWRGNFAPEHEPVVSKVSLLEISPYYGRPTVENYNLVVLTVVRVNGGFDWHATKIRVWSF